MGRRDRRNEDQCWHGSDIDKRSSNCGVVDVDIKKFYNDWQRLLRQHLRRSHTTEQAEARKMPPGR
jgi:hypothetical protein